MPAKNHIHFSPPLAYSSDYPAAKFPALATEVGTRDPIERPLPENTRASFAVTQARHALAIIASAELCPDDIVLIPAYHCPALVEPFIWAGCRVEFYNMNSDLSPENNSLDSQLQKARAVIFIRYFGFEGNIEHLVERAHNFGCLVIEDLAHTAFIQKLYGDYGVTSWAKFYPVSMGADIYVAKDRETDPIQHAIQEQQVKPSIWRLQSIARKIIRKTSARVRTAPEKEHAFRYFDPFSLGETISNSVTKEIHRHSPANITNKRQINYQKIHSIMEPSHLGIALFAQLEAATTPYVYPFLLYNAQVFNQLRGAGIPLFRWEELAASNCRVSHEYRSKLIQIPCHQDLTDAQIELIRGATEKRTHSSL